MDVKEFRIAGQTVDARASLDARVTDLRVRTGVVPATPVVPEAPPVAPTECWAQVAQLHHTNIVPVYGVGCERGVHFYAMQFIEGRNLDVVLQELRGTGPIHENVPSKAAARCLDSLQYRESNSPRASVLRHGSSNGRITSRAAAK
jgi:hypothetical protein